jgi:hypothetical protein
MRGSSPARGARFQRPLFAVALAVALGGCVAYAGRGPGPGYGYGVEIAVAPPDAGCTNVPANTGFPNTGTSTTAAGVLRKVTGNVDANDQEDYRPSLNGSKAYAPVIKFVST